MRSEGRRCRPHTLAAAQAGTRRTRPAAEPVTSQGNRPRCRQGAGTALPLPAPARRQPFNGRAAPSAPAPLAARPRRCGPARSFRLAAGGRGARTRTRPRPPAPRSRFSLLVVSQAPHLTAGRAQHQPPRPQLPPRTSPHPTRHDRGVPPAVPLEPGGARASHRAVGCAYPGGGGAAAC